MPDQPGFLRRLYNQVMPEEGLVPRLMGGVMSDATAARNPEMEKAWAGRSLEFPENAANVNRIGEMGYLKRKILGDHTYGSTSPFGTIELNMPAIKADNQDINDVLAHEMTHARQGVTGWLKGMMGSPEPDYEAINTESLRNVRRGDIPLRTPNAPLRNNYMASNK